MIVTDEMVEAALFAWYLGEWPSPVNHEGTRLWESKMRRDMRAALEAAIALMPGEE